MVTGSILLLIILAALVFIVLACALMKWHPMLVLLVTALVTGIATGLGPDKTITTIFNGAGTVFAAIGYIIVAGTLLGEVLEKTGGAAGLADKLMGSVSKKKILPATAAIGLLVGIPVFCDSGFIVLTRLVQAMANVTGHPAASMQLALATGLYTSHVIIPPTPGPMAAAGNLGLSSSLGWVILLGIIVSIPSIITALWMVKKIDYPIMNQVSEQLPEKPKQNNAGKALFVLLLPLLLITTGVIIPSVTHNDEVVKTSKLLGHPAIALFISAIIAMVLLGSKQRQQWGEWISTALVQSGPIILITTAGGAFGAILKETALQQEITSFLDGNNIPVIAIYPFAFALTAIFKTAQGSSTAAMIICSAMIYPILGAFELSLQQNVLVLLSISGGAMAISHANDSYFWVVSQYGKIPVRDMYRYYSVSTLLMGLSVMLTCILLHYLIGWYQASLS